MIDTPVSLVADVGGTNTRVALATRGEVHTDTTRRFRNETARSLVEIIERFLADCDVSECRGACVAVAGPVLDGVGRLTNRDWVFTRDDLHAATGAGTVSVLNDLQAQGHAAPLIPQDRLTDIVPGPDGDENAAKLVIGIGTGFNAVPVFRTETGRYVPPCESGHTTLPVLSDDDMSLSRYVRRHHGFPGAEDVLSGRGLEHVYAWASDTDEQRSSADIIAAIQSGDDPVAERAGRAFVQAFGRVAGDLALHHLPFGGIYVVGGMANAMLPFMERFGFREAFRDKGRFGTFMESFAVRAIDDDYAALTGCAQHLEGLFQQSA